MILILVIMLILSELYRLHQVGAMNHFILLELPDGSKELVTPPLSTGVILPGVTRRSIIEMTSTWPGLTVSERKITMGEVMAAQSEGRLVEMFGSGTAAIVSPVGGLKYNGVLYKVPTPQFGLASKFLQQLNDIYYGHVAHPWAVDVLSTNFASQVRLLSGDKRLENFVL